MAHSLWRSRFRAWLDHLAPRSCALCGLTLRPGALTSFCAPCILALPGGQRVRCARCALALAGPHAPAHGQRIAPSETHSCPGCPMPTCWFDQTLAVADYAPPFDRAVTALKFGRQLPLARPLGELLAARWRGHTPTLELDCLIPVPLSAPRLAQRGFNQALELARGMSTALPRNLPIERRALRRIRDTPAQTSLSMRARHVNLHEALVCPQRLDGARVGLVDDVMTSGTTLNEAARALKHAGASWVLGLVLARTAPPSTESHAAAAVQPSEAKPGRDPTATDQALEHLAPTKTRQRRPP